MKIAIRSLVCLSLSLGSLVSTCMADFGGIWAVGDGGTIVHASSLGGAWVRETSGTTNNLNGVFFLDRFQGWAVGNSGVVLHTCLLYTSPSPRD